MDQRDRAFVPRVLVVSVGSSVEFPNNDSVSHQVYSFSPAKRFQLALYKGETHPPVTFDQAGLVVLGCNIHDSMVGYIYVTPAPYFGTTEASGTLKLKDLPTDDYQIVVWSPYIADPPASLARSVHVEAEGAAAERFQLHSAAARSPGAETAAARLGLLMARMWHRALAHARGARAAGRGRPGSVHRGRRRRPSLGTLPPARPPS